MKLIEIPALDPEQLAALEDLYRTTRDARLRTRAQMVLLAAKPSPDRGEDHRDRLRERGDSQAMAQALAGRRYRGVARRVAPGSTA